MTQVYIMPAGRLCRTNFALGKKIPHCQSVHCYKYHIVQRKRKQKKLELPIKIFNQKDF